MLTDTQKAEIEAAATLAGLNPTEIELLIEMAMKYGPMVYTAILKLYHFVAPTK